MSILGDVISAGSSIAGGIMSKNEADQNRKFQKKAMKKSIQWRVKDAEKAGISPLYALGAPTFSPAVTMSGMPEAMAQAGQNIGRAADAYLDRDEKATAYTKSVEQLSLTRMGLENELLASQIANLRQPGSPPAAPGRHNLIPGQGSTGIGKVKTDPDVGPLGLKIPNGQGGALNFVTGPTSNSQTIADQYGDAAQEVYGMWRLLNDSLDNWDASNHWSSPQAMEKLLRSVARRYNNTGRSKGYPGRGGRY